MEDLLAELTINILSRLPVKAVFHCKCVCKKWRNLLLESSFVRLHHSRPPTTLIIHHTTAPMNDPGILEWVEIEDKDDYHNLHHDPLMSLDLNLAPIIHKSPIDLVGSVNGLICLLQSGLGPNDDNTYICNPATREYMILPTQQDCYTEHYGFGMSKTTGEYKVIRTFQQRHKSVSEAQVYTLGTGQWRSLGRLPYRLRQSDNSDGSFLNGHCHWILYDTEDALCTFDFDKETFQLFPSPPPLEGSDYHPECLAILKGCLCKMEHYESQFTMWVMKEYGIKESWHKELVINQGIKNPDLNWPMTEPLNLIVGLKDGSILTQCEDELWAFYPKNKTIEDTGLFEFYSSPRGMAYRPSFLKLQNFELERVHMF